MVDLQWQISAKEAQIKALEERILLQARGTEKKGIEMNVKGVDLAPAIESPDLTSLDLELDERKGRWKEYYDWLEEYDKSNKDKRLEGFYELANTVGDGISALADLFEAAKQRELSAAGDNAKKREEIEKNI